MGKRGKTKAIRGEFYLPEPIIHRIQSFLTRKEAARTAVVSRPWYSAWLSRPNLEFDEGDFCFNPKPPDEAWDSSDEEFFEGEELSDSHSVEFLKLVEMTIQRYEQSNLKIKRLRLRLRRRNSISDDSNPASHLIVRALKIGATHISFRSRDPFSALPVGVFESGNLVKLSVKGCNIDPGMDQKVICPKLESLILSDLLVKSEVIFKIISSFPMIKKLSFSGFIDFRKTKGSIGFPKLHELRCLVLRFVNFDKLFLADLSSKLPSLEDLTLYCCSNVREICSRSLKCIDITASGGVKEVKFDVPSIKKFTFQGYDFPSLSFESTSREWESHVFKKLDRILWFSGLKGMLTQLRTSKIHLTLSQNSVETSNYKPGEGICGLPNCQVENVTIKFARLSCFSRRALFDGLFRLCRPKFITHTLHPENKNNDLLCKTLVRGMNGEFSSPSSFMHGLHGLEEAKMELYDEDVAAWRPLPLESLLDGSMKTPKEQKDVRFQLKWKP